MMLSQAFEHLCKVGKMMDFLESFYQNGINVTLNDFVQEVAEYDCYCTLSSKADGSNVLQP